MMLLSRIWKHWTKAIGEHVGAELILFVKNAGGGQEANGTFIQEVHFLGFWIIEKFPVSFATMQEVLSETLRCKLLGIHTCIPRLRFFLIHRMLTINIWRKKKHLTQWAYKSLPLNWVKVLLLLIKCLQVTLLSISLFATHVTNIEKYLVFSRVKRYISLSNI